MRSRFRNLCIVSLVLLGPMAAGGARGLAQNAASTNPTPAGTAAHPDPTGTYMYTWGFAAGGLGKTGDLPGGLKNEPLNLENIPSKPWALELEKATVAEDDPARLCLPLGPFRMQQNSGNYFELLPSPGEITMLFQIVDQGQVRRIHLDSPHPAKLYPTWNGDSRGHWEGDTLVVDTTGFNDKTWLNGSGARHSDALHLVERFRFALGGDYIEYKATIDDAKAMDGTFSYTRIYKKLKDEEITEYVCNEDPDPVMEVYNPNGQTPKPSYSSKRMHPEGIQNPSN